jgi:hypothetical protein
MFRTPLKRVNQKIFTSHIINFATGFTFAHFTSERRYMHCISTHTPSFCMTTLSVTLTKCLICGTDNLSTTLLSNDSLACTRCCARCNMNNWYDPWFNASTHRPPVMYCAKKEKSKRFWNTDLIRMTCVKSSSRFSYIWFKASVDRNGNYLEL